MSSNRYTMGELAPAHVTQGAPPRKKNRWLRAALIVFMLMALSFGGCVTYGYMKLRKSPESELAANSVLVMRLQGSMPFDGAAGVQALLEGQRSLSVNTLRRALAKASTDTKIERVALVVDQLSVGFGTVEVLREIIHDFKRSGKEIAVLIEADNAGEAELYLASAASKVMLSPHATVTFDGLAADVSFFGQSLEKLGIKPEVIQFKQYKSAFEPWMGSKMSAPMRESTTALLASTWNNVIEGMAQDRKVPAQKLRDFANQGMVSGQGAIEAGLVDLLGYYDELLAAQPESVVSVGKYLQRNRLGFDSLPSEEEKPSIALISATGNIVVDGSGSFVPGAMLSGRALAAKVRKAAQDKDIAAILIWVDSPGGSMVGSDLVWREVKQARELHKKPVVISMGSVAASGGYWISMGADAIVAAPSTVTGSIGVIFGRVSMKEFLSKLGLSHDTVIEGGKNANMGSMWDPLTSEQRSNLEKLLGEAYAQFVGKVAQGRSRSVEEIEAVAKGRVWTGSDALAHGLVDRLGGVLTAVQLCKEELGLTQDTQVDLRSYPRQDLWQQILGSPSEIFGISAWATQKPSRVLEQVDAQLHQASSPRAWARAPNLRVY